MELVIVGGSSRALWWRIGFELVNDAATPLLPRLSLVSWISLVVYAKRPFGGPEHVLRYLGGYTHRVAISNHRLVAFEQGKVTFRWRDSACKNKKRRITLAADEFLRRFLLHLLPRGFVRIRNFGFLANRHRARLLPLCFALLGAAVPAGATTSSAAADPCEFWLCPLCGGPMSIVERLTALDLRVRPPPQTRVPR